jgi:hypothetical protein
MASELDELRRRLDRVEAREACVSTFNEYLHYLDGDFVDELLQVFAPDAELNVIDFPPGTGKDLHFRGRSEIRPLYAEHRAGIGRHHSANVTVNPAPDAQRAELSAYFITSGPFQFGGGIYQIELAAAPERWLIERMNIVSTWGWRIEGDAQPYLAKALGTGAWRAGRPVRYRP